MAKKEEKEFKTHVTISLSASTRELAKELSDNTGLPVSHIIELLLNGTSEKEILKLAEKKK